MRAASVSVFLVAASPTEHGEDTRRAAVHILSDSKKVEETGTMGVSPQVGDSGNTDNKKI